MDASAIVSAAAGAAAKESEGAVAHVDPFLVETLQNPRHRLTVLRMELDIQKFLQMPDLFQFEFQHLPTSYLRCVAHRVAQHYGLQTMAVDNNVSGLGAQVIARKTPESRFPAVCLSEIPTKQPEKDTSEEVKIAIRQRPNKSLSSDAVGLGGKANFAKTVEERQEEYNKARARIFSGSTSHEVEGSSSFADGRSSCSSSDFNECYMTVKDSEQIVMKDDASRVAIFRDREKDLCDPDYDRRRHDRYDRVMPSPNFGMGGSHVLQMPFPRYDAGFSQMSQLQTNPGCMSYMPPNMTINPFAAPLGSCHTSMDAVYIQWPDPAVMYANSYEHFRHAAVQAPFYQHQHPLSFDHS